MIKKLSTLVLITLFFACKPAIKDDPIPYVSFENIRINLTNIQYYDLTTKGYIEISGGVKGIILYKNPFKNEYLAYERNCTYLPYDECAKVNIDNSGLFMIDPCCESQFSFTDGNPIAGPASAPLRRYRTILDGNLLIITDEPFY